MSETTLNVRSEIVLPPALRSTIYRTNNVRNDIELQTLEKAFDKIVATSKDSSSLTFNIPSISGGAMYRNLEMELPITWSISYKSVAPSIAMVAPTNIGINGEITPIPASTPLAIINLGSNVRPFLSHCSCLDQFPLSKILRNRTFQFNNSSVTLKEDLAPELIDQMVACMNIDRMVNDGLEVFADANCHFNILREEFGGVFLPFMFQQNATPPETWNTILFSDFVVTPTAGDAVSVAQSTYASTLIESALTEAFGSSKYKISSIKENWALNRNTARNIISSKVEVDASTPFFNGATLQVDSRLGFGQNAVPATLSAPPYFVAYYDNVNTVTLNFTTTVREQLVSQYFNHEYNYNEFSWNELIPLSTLNMKFVYDLQYLSESVLKMAEKLSSYPSFAITKNPTIGNQGDCYFIMRSCKIPASLQLDSGDSYKCMYYDQITPQGGVTCTKQNNVISATMYYANLSQVSDYIMPYLKIDRAKYIRAIEEIHPFQLPSTLNLPITNLQITFNSDSGLASYSLDYFQLQKMTLQNLQENEKLRELIVGKSKQAVGTTTTSTNIVAPNITGNIQGWAFNIANGLQFQASYGDYDSHYSGVSNSSFLLLKLGSQLRLPDGYTSGLLVNHNIKITASCDLNSSLFKTLAGFKNENTKLINPLVFGSPDFTANLEVVHMVKKLFTLSGPSLQSLYIHDLQLIQSNYLDLRGKYESAFAMTEKDDLPFGADMMIGGAGIGQRIKSFVMKSIPYLQKAPGVVRQVADFAKMVPHPGVQAAAHGVSNVARMLGGVGSMDPNVVSGGMDANVVSGGRGRGRQSGSKSAGNNAQWQSYLQNL